LGALAQPMLFSALVVCFAWVWVNRYFATSGPQVGVTVGGVLLMAAYGTMQGLFRMERGPVRR
jgi:hypothetical protein